MTFPSSRSRRPMNKVGHKTRVWKNTRDRLKKKFAAMGITQCELNYDGCAFNNFLGFAHGRKRRHLEGDELETLVILACNNCHDQIERLPAEAMLTIVEKVIADREEMLEEMERERVTEECWKEYCDGKAAQSQYNY